MNPRPTGAIFYKFVESTTDVEQEMTNAVKTEMQLYNSSGKWSLPRASIQPSDVNIYNFSVHSLQQVFVHELVLLAH